MNQYIISLLLVLHVSLISCDSSKPEKETNETVENTVGGTRSSWQVVRQEEMVLVPGGVFEMGAKDGFGFRDENTLHTVQVDSFWMDEHEVTNDEFARFVAATGYVTSPEKPL